MWCEYVCYSKKPGLWPYLLRLQDLLGGGKTLCLLRAAGLGKSWSPEPQGPVGEQTVQGSRGDREQARR